MVAITDQQKARLHDLTVSVLELVRDGKRDVDQVCALLQQVKDGETGTAKRLHPAGEILLPAFTDPFDPNEFFQTREGLWTWDRFRDRILSLAKPTDSLEEATFLAFDLTEDANDAEIRKDLPENHVFGDASVFCARLAQMIERQPEGKEGNLLTNGCANIFYVRVKDGEPSAVDVYWRSGGREWDVYCHSLRGDRWIRGDRVFFSNC